METLHASAIDHLVLDFCRALDYVHDAGKISKEAFSAHSPQRFYSGGPKSLLQSVCSDVDMLDCGSFSNAGMRTLVVRLGRYRGRTKARKRAPQPTAQFSRELFRHGDAFV